MAKSYLATHVNDDNWTASLDLIGGYNTASRRMIQEASVFLVKSYLDPEASTAQINTATRRMTSLYKKAQLISAHRQLLTFFKAHVNVKGENVGKKNFAIVKSGNGKPREKQPITGWWYNYEAEKTAPSARSVNQMVDTFLKTLSNKQEKGLISDPEHIADFVAYINAYSGLNAE